MNTKLKLYPLLLASAAFSLSAQAQAHVHGQGEMFISQEGNQWSVQLEIPAGDALGFEHSPETEEQQQAVSELAKKLEDNANILVLNGDCSLDKMNHNLNAQEEEHHHDHEHEHEGEHEEEHHDVEVEYYFSCDSETTELSIKLFDWLESVEKIQAQWVIQNGQGQKEVTHEQPYIEWN